MVKNAQKLQKLFFLKKDLLNVLWKKKQCWKNNKSLKKNVVYTKHEEKGRYYKNYMLLIMRSNDHLLKQEQNLHNIVKQQKHIPKKQQQKKKKRREWRDFKWRKFHWTWKQQKNWMLSVKMMHVWWKQREWWSWEDLLRSSWNITSQKTKDIETKQASFCMITKWKYNKKKPPFMTPLCSHIVMFS